MLLLLFLLLLLLLCLCLIIPEYDLLLCVLVRTGRLVREPPAVTPMTVLVKTVLSRFFWWMIVHVSDRDSGAAAVTEAGIHRFGRFDYSFVSNGLVGCHRRNQSLSSNPPGGQLPPFSSGSCSRLTTFRTNVVLPLEIDF